FLYSFPSAKQPRHLNDGGVKNVEHELRSEADREHEQGGRNDDEFFTTKEIGKTGATFGERAAEEQLHRAHERYGRKKETQHRDRSEGSGNCKRAFENEKLANKSVESGQAERRKHRDAHPAAEQRRALHQSTEIVDASRAAALFEQTDEIKQRGGGDPVIENLQKHTAQRRGHVDQSRCRCCNREKAEQAVAEMIDRQVRDHAFEIALRPRCERCEDNRTDREREQPRCSDFNFIRKQRNEQSNETVDAHFR